MQRKPVNSISGDANILRVNDTGSQIKLLFKDAGGETVNLQDNIDYFYLTRDRQEYFAVEDIEFDGDHVLFRPPALKPGYYQIEVKDKVGVIYPAGKTVSIQLQESFESGKEAEFISYREAIIEDVEPIVIQHMTDNAEQYKGDKGDAVLAPPKIYTRDEYIAMTDRDPNTLYFISEVTT